VDVVAGDAPADAVKTADIVLLCTTSSTPVIEDAWVADGTTVVSIGSFAPDRHEVPQDLVRRARIVVDDVASALTDAGPVVRAIEDGTRRATDLVGLGDVLTGRARGRSADDEVVYYNSVGLGIQDAAAAQYILSTARAAGIGTELRW